MKTNASTGQLAKFLALLVPELIILTVDYGLTLEQMIAVGNYDWKNDDLTDKRFPIKGDGVQEFEACLIHPNRSISSEDCIQLIKDTDKTNPWEPAQTEHLLAYGAKYPEEQRKFPIIALGSVGKVNSDPCLPCLVKDDGWKRSLRLRWFGRDWSTHCRFLVVRKKVSGK